MNFPTLFMGVVHTICASYTWSQTMLKFYVCEFLTYGTHQYCFTIKMKALANLVTRYCVPPLSHKFWCILRGSWKNAWVGHKYYTCPNSNIRQWTGMVFNELWAWLKKQREQFPITPIGHIMMWMCDQKYPHID